MALPKPARGSKVQSTLNSDLTQLWDLEPSCPLGGEPRERNVNLSEEEKPQHRRHPADRHPADRPAVSWETDSHPRPAKERESRERAANHKPRSSPRGRPSWAAQRRRGRGRRLGDLRAIDCRLRLPKARAHEPWPTWPTRNDGFKRSGDGSDARAPRRPRGCRCRARLRFPAAEP